MKESSDDFLNIKSAVVIVFTLALICTGCMPLVRYTASKLSRQEAPNQQTAPKVPYRAENFDANTPYYLYQAEIAADLAKSDFAAIEQKAKSAIDNKERFDGGDWKISAIHGALDSPSNALVSSDQEWQEHFARLENWQKQAPDSITPVLALSDSYQNYGYQARGQGYADTVSEADHKLYEERLTKSAKYLKEASQKQTGSPVFYELLLSLGIGQGWDRTSFEKAFQEAVEYEPDYQNYYQTKAVYLLPRWYGKPGEWEKFADETLNTLGDKKGAEMYFQIVSEMSRMHGTEFFQKNKVNWDKTREGFTKLEKEYGTNRRSLNLMARMAVHRLDLEMSCATFKRLGENDYEPNVGYTKEKYLSFRKMGLQMCDVPPELQKEALKSGMEGAD